jgi:hypothetical protein
MCVCACFTLDGSLFGYVTVFYLRFFFIFIMNKFACKVNKKRFAGFLTGNVSEA